MMMGPDQPRASFWAGKPQGKEVQLGAIEAYVAKPDGPIGTHGILLLADHRGWKKEQVRLYADKLASHGQLCAIPDLFKGDEPLLRAMRDGDHEAYQAWQRRHSEEVVLRDIKTFLESLRAQYHLQDFGAIGFCWGALHSALLAGSDQVKAVVLNNPSRGFREGIFQDSKQPMLINAADSDEHLPSEELKKYQDILAGLADTPSDVKVFEGMTHGWTTRVDPDNEKAVQDAFNRSLDWFSKYL